MCITNQKQLSPSRPLQYASSRLEVLSEKLFLEILQNSEENTCASVSFLIKLQAETLAQVFSSEFCKISINMFSYRTPPVVASVNIH